MGMLLHPPAYLCPCAYEIRAYADYFSRQSAPNVLLTTCYKPSKLMFHFLADMLEVLPCAQFFKRQVHRCTIYCRFGTSRSTAVHSYRTADSIVCCSTEKRA